MIEVCKKYQTTNSGNTTEQTSKNPLEEILSNLTRIQREVINSYILVNANSLSVRSKNAISQFLKQNFSVRNFAEKILLNRNFHILNIDNVGKKSIPELEVYISIVNDIIIDVNEANDEKQLITLKNNFLIQRTFSISKIPSEILQSESIFQLTDFLLKNNALFNENHNLIIQKTLKIYQNDREHTLDEIALENNLSRERVRQIRKDCINELFESTVVFLLFRYFNSYFSSTNDCEPKDHIFPVRYVIVIDEAHIYLKNKNARKALEDLLRLLRSKGVILVMLSQGVEDYKTKDFDFASQVKLPICLNVQNKDYKAISNFVGTPSSKYKLETEIKKLDSGKGLINIGEPKIIELRQWWKTKRDEGL